MWRFRSLGVKRGGELYGEGRETRIRMEVKGEKECKEEEEEAKKQMERKERLGRDEGNEK